MASAGKPLVPAPAEVRAILTKSENMLLGIVGSLIASSVQMPVLTWKFCSQRGVPLPDTLAGFYRGIGVRLTAVVPLNVTTIVVNGILENLFGATDAKPLTKVQKMICAFTAGCSSSPIQSVMDTTIMHQQRLGLSMAATWKALLGEHGLHAVTHGLIPTAAREAIGAVGFLTLSPVFGELISKKLNISTASFAGKIAAAFVGSFPAGFTSSAITMSVDAAKTKSVADMARKEYRSTWDALYKIWGKEGILALYKGFFQRTLVLVITMFILPVMRELAISYKTKRLYGRAQSS